MSQCWAYILGDCEGVTSREHIVSDSLFMSPTVKVQGFPWCKDTLKDIGVGSLTSKILCRRHNSLLSPLDQAASEAFDALRQQTKLANDRAKLKLYKFKVMRFRINAILLERWLLKTLINFSFGSKYIIGANGNIPGWPPNQLVRIAFGLEPFPERSGMYIAANTEMQLNFKDTVEFSPLLKDDTYIFGGFFSFRGIRMFLDLHPEGLPVPISLIPGVRDDWKNANLLYRFKEIRATHGNHLSHVVKFKW